MNQKASMKNSFIPSFQCESALEDMGSKLRIARLRRNESVQIAAQRLGISRAKYQRLENGDSNVSAGALIEALILYGFESQVFALADPDLDETGKRLEKQLLPKRGRTHAK